MLFDFLSMAANYEDRKIARYEKDDILVDTCAVNDSDQPYETGVVHPQYNNGECIIVELYDTKKEAKIGHKKWVKTMTAEKLPKVIKDVSSSEIQKLCNIFGDKRVYKRVIKTKIKKSKKVDKNSTLTN